MKAIVDKDTCISCGLCPSMCPEVFEMQDDDKAGVKNDKNEIPEDVVSSAQEARDACPVDAISIE